MKKTPLPNAERRQLLKWMGGSVAILSVTGLAGCSDGGSESGTTAAKPQAKPQPEPKPQPAAKPAPQPAQAAPAAEPPAETVAQTPAKPDTQAAAANTGEMPVLSEDNPQAQALGYVSDSSRVDASRYPNHAADQACSNCALYTGQAGQDAGPCGIFPGRQVSAKGWCSAYNRKA